MSDLQKLPCYGDYEKYDPSSDECAECAYINGCGIRSMRNKKEDYASDTVPKTTSTNSSYRGYSSQRSASRSAIDRYREGKRNNNPSKYAVAEEEPSEDDTFLDILRHNASIEAVQAVFDELSNSIRHIPRRTYTNFRRKKK